MTTFKVNESIQESCGSFEAQMAEMLKTNPKWMGVFIGIDESGKMSLSRTCYDFPFDRMIEVFSLLAKTLEEERLCLVGEELANKNELGQDEFEKLRNKLTRPAQLRDDDPPHEFNLVSEEEGSE